MKYGIFCKQMLFDMTLKLGAEKSVIEKSLNVPELTTNPLPLCTVNLNGISAFEIGTTTVQYCPLPN